MNRIAERVRAMLRRKEVVPVPDIWELCDETEALQDVIDRIAKRDAEEAFRQTEGS